MKTLSSPITTQAAAEQAGWAELYDIYLKTSITTPFGTVSTLRLTTCPGGLSFFTPLLPPEPSSPGAAQAYQFWPLKRGSVKTDSKSSDSKFTFAASNVTAEWATMLSAVDWHDVAVVVRKVSLSITTPANTDCVVLFTGLIDAARITNESISFTCSNGMALLNQVLPRENMHQNCRFRWADDQCTALRYLTENYKAKTVGSSSTTTRVKSAGLTEDAGSAASYGTELINALADANVTSSSSKAAYAAQAITVDATRDWFLLTDHGFVGDEEITFTGTPLPSPLVAATVYYAKPFSNNYCKVSLTPGGAAIDLTTNGTTVKITTPSDYAAKQVKSSNAGYWQLDTSADWGTKTNAYWQIPTLQAGLANAALKPYVQFDLGSAKTPRLWRFANIEGISRLEELVRQLVIFSSSDAATWAHEGFFEIPPVGGVLYDCNLPKASTKRYWRVCVRSKWATSYAAKMLAEVQAYENGRNWWKNGNLTFDAATTTVALRGIVRKVVESYSGEVVVGELPAAPASGDTFVIERGCGRTWNDCCERKNWENYGGFHTLPNETIIR